MSVPRLMLFGGLAVLAVLAAACAEYATNQPTPVPAATVAATPGLRFEPAEVAITAGGQVTWQFAQVPHNVFFTSGAQPPADIPDLTTNAGVTRVFPTVGTYAYECRVHPGMAGRVVVVEQPGGGPYGSY